MFMFVVFILSIAIPAYISYAWTHSGEDKQQSARLIEVEDRVIATAHSASQIDNANLIYEAVNQCTSVNPDNPLAVAQNIKEMYEALKAPTDKEMYQRAAKVLSKVEAKDEL